MVTYARLLSVVARQVRACNGRGISPGLSEALNLSCAKTASSASMGFQLARSNSSRTLDSSLMPEGTPLNASAFYAALPPETIAQIAIDALTVMAELPSASNLICSAVGESLLVSLFLSALLRSSSEMVMTSKAVTASLLASSPLSEVASGKLIVCLHVLVRGPLQSEGDTLRCGRWPPAAQRAGLLAAAEEVLSRLPGAGTEGWPTEPADAAPPAGKPRRSFQRRSPPATPAVGIAGTASDAGGVDNRGSKEAPHSLQEKLRRSSTHSVTESECMDLLIALYRLAQNESIEGAGAANLELGLRLLDRAVPLVPRLSLFTRAVTARETGALNFRDWTLLLYLLCFPSRLPSTASAALRYLQTLTRPSTDGAHTSALCSLQPSEIERIRVETVRWLSRGPRTKESGGSSGGGGDIETARAVDRFTPQLLLFLLRDHRGGDGTGNPFVATVANLSTVSRGQLQQLTLRLYWYLLMDASRGPRSGSAEAPTLSLAQMAELDQLAEAQQLCPAWEACSGRRARTAVPTTGGGGAAPCRTTLAPLFHPRLTTLGLRSAQLLLHSATAGYVVTEAERSELVDLVSATIAEERGLLMHLRDWDVVVEALACAMHGSGNGTGVVASDDPPSASALTERAACTFCEAIDCLTALVSHPEPGTQLDVNRFKIMQKVVRALPRAWAAPLPNLVAQRTTASARVFLAQCVRLAGSGANVPAAPAPTAPRLRDGNAASVTATVAMHLLLRLEERSTVTVPAIREEGQGCVRDESGADPPTTEERAGARDSYQGDWPAGAPVLTMEQMREAMLRSLTDFGKGAGSAGSPTEVLQAVEAAQALFHLGASDAAALSAAVAAMRAMGSPATLARLPWRHRSTLVRSCLKLYTMVQRQFASSKGCRQVGQQCLVMVTRLCLDRYAPSSMESATGTDPDVSRCAEAVWKLCVVAVERPLRTSSLDKYLVIMNRFVREHWAEPPPAPPRARLLAAEDALAHLWAGHADVSVSVDTLETAPDDVRALVVYNRALLLMAIAPLRLTFRLLREDREVRARRARRYLEMYLTMCHVALRRADAVVPSVWVPVMDQAVLFPSLFGSAGANAAPLQHALEVSAREVLRRAEEKGNRGRWVMDSRLRPGTGTGAPADGAAQAGEEALLPPQTVYRVYAVMGHLTCVEARVYLTTLAQEVVDELPDWSSRSPEARGECTGVGQAEDAGGEDDAARHRNRERTKLLTGILSGLRSAGRRARRQ